MRLTVFKRIDRPVVIAKPNEDSLGALVNLSHQLDLMITLQQLVLIDADGVDPDQTTLPDARWTKSAQGGEAVLRDQECATVTEDSLTQLLTSPTVRNSFVFGFAILQRPLQQGELDIGLARSAPMELQNPDVALASNLTVTEDLRHAVTGP